MNPLNMIIVGVGGQGTLLSSKILGQLAIESGLDVKLSEVHGMAQRGGSVETHIRIAEHVYSPLVEPGTADIVLGFEPMEAMRWSHYLAPDGMLVTNSSHIWPMPVVSGKVTYPDDLFEKMEEAGIKYKTIDAQGIADSINSPRSTNIVLLGFVSELLPFTYEQWIEAIKKCVPSKTLEANIKAFDLGLEAAK